MKNLFYVFCVSFLKNRLAKNLLAFLTLLFLLLPQYACNTTEPPSNQTFLLKLEDISCTEAWVQFSSANIQIPNNITLYINNQPKKTINLISADTLLYIDSLLPNQTYKILAAMQPYNNASNELSVTTMDTTTHNFTWQTWTFGGQAGSCALYDVAIIDENNIWAVGEIYMNDSLGNPDPISYNALHWNGQSWELKKIKTNACGGVDYPPIKAIFAFSSNDILFAHIDGSISHFNGIGFTNDCSLITQLNGSANKIWGVSINDFYVVSGNGFIAHYQNGKWTKIESGTDLPINDIWGFTNLNDGQQNIYCIASDKYQFVDKKILKISSGNLVEISNEGLPWSLSSIWFKSKYKCYIVGDGIFTINLLNAKIWQNITQGITPYYTHSIRGNGLNDVVVVGSFGELLHFNGLTWYSYKGRELPEFIGNYFSVGIKGNSVCAVGQATINSNVAIIALGIK
jgi:hypothetical protein